MLEQFESELTFSSCSNRIPDRTIHGLVYNALKLFMEINPSLFDLCTNDFKQQRQLEKHKVKARDDAWRRLRESAITNSKIIGAPVPKTLADDEKAPPLVFSDTDSLDSNQDISGTEQMGNLGMGNGMSNEDEDDEENEMNSNDNDQDGNGGHRSNGEISTTDFQDAPQHLGQSSSDSQDGNDWDLKSNKNNPSTPKLNDSENGLEDMKGFPETSRQNVGKGQESPHVRRKSVIPMDPAVLQELAGHKSLDE